jgi:L-rhamnose mutarotase
MGAEARAGRELSVDRRGFVIRLRPGRREEYERIHEAVWPEVLATIEACGIRNYSIFLKRLDDGRDYLFATYEYVGKDYAADQRKMAADPATQRWWKITDPMQEPIEARAEGERWAAMREVFRLESGSSGPFRREEP